MWRASRFPPPECLEACALPPKNGLRLNDLRRTDQPSLDAFIDSHFEIRSAKPPPGVATLRDINGDMVSLHFSLWNVPKSIAEIDRTNQIIPASRGAPKTQPDGSKARPPVRAPRLPAPGAATAWWCWYRQAPRCGEPSALPP
jgi:hypothetical protein